MEKEGAPEARLIIGPFKQVEMAPEPKPIEVSVEEKEAWAPFKLGEQIARLSQR